MFDILTLLDRYIKTNYQITHYVWSLLVERFYLQQYSEGIFIWNDNGFKNKMNIVTTSSIFNKNFKFRFNVTFLRLIMGTQSVIDILVQLRENFGPSTVQLLFAPLNKWMSPLHRFRTLQLI
jgi:hypothetical protein